MRNQTRWSLALPAVAAAVLTLGLSGCAGTYTGGGYLPSTANPDGKATYGFNVHGIDDNGDELTDRVKGQVQYVDRPAGVAFHGVVTEQVFDTTDRYTGTYRPAPASLGPGGTFVLIPLDNGEPATEAGDRFSIRLIGGVFNGYQNGGVVNGGNIQFHPPDQ